MKLSLAAIVTLLTGILIAGCGSREAPEQVDEPLAPGPVVMGVVMNDNITEASGLVNGRVNPDLLWVHNDSGDIARIFAISTYGDAVGEIHLDGIQARDWEDIALGPGLGDTLAWLYVGEIGDNNEVHERIYVYRLEEPKAFRMADSVLTVSDVERLIYRYPDGPHDAEALLIDPQTSDLFIVTKGNGKARVYHAPAPHVAEQTRTLAFVRELPFSDITAGDISFDGHHILLKTYTNVYHWTRNEGERVGDVLAGAPDTLTYIPEPQGEAVAFNLAATGYYTISEERNNIAATVSFYPFSRKIIEANTD